MVHLRQLHEKYGGRAQSLFVYIREAGHLLPEALRDFRNFTEPDEAPPGSRPRLLQRVRAGRDHFGLHFPCLLDNEESDVEKLYAAFPRRMLVVDPAGRIVVDSSSFPNAIFPWKETTDWLDRYDQTLQPRPAEKHALTAPGSRWMLRRQKGNELVVALTIRAAAVRERELGALTQPRTPLPDGRRSVFASSLH